MSRWSQSNTQKTTFTVGENKVMYTQYRYFIGDCIDAHNADCDDYEARIAELTAELARVKAESLRVVADGDACRVGEEPRPAIVTWNNCTLWIDNGTELKGEHWCYDVARGSMAFDTIDDDAIVQPVRLERWEDEA